jgi:hypothetical protein
MNQNLHPWFDFSYPSDALFRRTFVFDSWGSEYINFNFAWVENQIL